MTDPNGNNTYTDYDSYGRAVAVRADINGGTSTLETYSYSANFPLSARTDYATGTSDPGMSFRKYFDGLGRHLHTVRTADNGRYVRTGTIVYDAIGREIRKGQTDFASADEINNYRVNNSEKNPSLTTYDSSGRVRTVTLPRAASEDRQAVLTTTYNDPWEVTTAHSAGTSQRTIKNARGHVLYVTDFGTGDTGAAVTATVGFCYDIAGNRVKKSDLNAAALSCGSSNNAIPAQDTGGNNIAYWRYDSFEQVVAQSDPDLGVTNNVYNGFGDMVSTTDALSRTTSMTYDRLGRMTQKVLPASEGTVFYEYDSNPESSNARGRLTAVYDPAASIIMSYDELGRKTFEKRVINDHTISDTDVPYVTTVTYDLMSRTKEINYPENPRTNESSRACYTYNAFGYMASIGTRLDGASSGGCDESIVDSTAFNEFGQMTRIDYGNSTSANYQYDVKGRLEYIQTLTTDSSGTTTTIQDARYTFNAQDSIKRVENNADEFQTDYQYIYDGINRLITASGSYVETDDGSGTAQTTPLEYKRGYIYAQNGNLNQKHFYDTSTDTIQETWDYTYVNHQARVIDSDVDGTRFQMSYDGVGNMVHQHDLKNGKEKAVTFNSYNRIREVVDPNVGAGQVIGQYWYDDRGFRVRKLAKHDKGGDFKDVEVIYPSMYFGMEYIQEDDALNSVANIYHNGLRIAGMAQNGAKVWYLTDQVDSVKFVIDGNADVITRTEYMPYGETFVQKGDEDFAAKYNSQELDRETNYYFYNARYYDPEIARFTSADTVIDGEFTTQGWNRFMYVQGNPIGAKDPTGHEAADPRLWRLLYDLPTDTGIETVDSIGQSGHDAARYMDDLFWSVFDPNYLRLHPAVGGPALALEVMTGKKVFEEPGASQGKTMNGADYVESAAMAVPIPAFKGGQALLKAGKNLTPSKVKLFQNGEKALDFVDSAVTPGFAKADKTSLAGLVTGDLAIGGRQSATFGFLESLFSFFGFGSDSDPTEPQIGESLRSAVPQVTVDSPSSGGFSPSNSYNPSYDSGCTVFGLSCSAAPPQ